MKWIITLAVLIVVTSCNDREVSTPKTSTGTTIKIKRNAAVNFIDTGFLKVSFKNSDDDSREYMQEQLKPIRDNFKRINSISNEAWSLVMSKELSDAEGGNAVFYYYNNHLEKITTRYFGESGQKLTEYYLMNGSLSFVFEKEAVYNRPIYYDSTAMKENNDTLCFDIKQSEIIEDRRYFKDNKIISQINNQDCGAPDAPELILEEQKRVLDDFNALMRLVKTDK